MYLKDTFITKEELLEIIATKDIEWIQIKKKKEIIEYANVRCSLDIENSFFYVDNVTGKIYDIKYFKELGKLENGSKIQNNFLNHVTKRGITYAIMFGYEGYCVLFREWPEYIEFMDNVTKILELSASRILPCGVHNLSWEFQWMRTYFAWSNIFAREVREPMKALTTSGIEFRCTYVLSGMSLDMVAKNLTKHKINKKVGDLDYDLLYSPLSVLDEKALSYCIYDVLIVMAYIDEEIEQWGDVTKIPMTSTGKVRAYIREKCLGKFNPAFRKTNKYFNNIHKLYITDPGEYVLLVNAFSGGFTHANNFYSGITLTTIKEDLKTHKNWKLVDKIFSKDFTSSYPYCLLLPVYPVGKGNKIEIKTIEKWLELSKEFCIIGNIKFYNVISKIDHEHYLSASKCRLPYNEVTHETLTIDRVAKENNKLKEKYNIEFDNGRIIQSDYIDTTLTEYDLDTFLQCYDYDDYEIGSCYIYNKGYLPKEIISCVLDFYEKKNTLKDISSPDGSIERMYQYHKSCLNGIYGDFVTKVCNFDILYKHNSWINTENTMTLAEIEQHIWKCLQDYNDKKTRYNYWPWGIYCTSIARHNLWSAILELGDDYLYADTDSVKYFNPDKHEDYFNNYNKEVEENLKKTCSRYGLDFNRVAPKTVKGKVKMLGVWDDDGEYIRFKTLGSKRYLVEYIEDGENHLKCTIAGVNKKKTSKWFMEHYEQAFDMFTDEMTVPAEYSGRLIVAYIDEETEGDIIDCQGNNYHYHEGTSINMTPSDYNLTLNDLYRILLGSNIKYEY